MRWGLIPSWAKDTSIGTQTLNARSETVTTKGISRSDPKEALPYSIEWILRVAEDGISEAALLF
jgi:hypothetical protein